ncbi:glycoside hydrolase family 20 protein [Periconia macrospinosa]|uniref:beta-N-acetylhexosaminidase n=1 Tax=Periconia macrospinosa TaxID=97972 RepID=A0A2V1DE52_9PLEO|nr:glycoside hydrolase family 20 protein [Periconia macrospinosa]
MIFRSLWFLAVVEQAGGRLLGIPTVPFNTSGSGSYSLSGVVNILIDGKYAAAIDTRGQTLIPPTLSDFAKTFSEDLTAITQKSELFLVNSNDPSAPAGSSITLTLGNATDYLDAAGRETSEGYTLDVSSSGIKITGASPLGVWWGTRTVLQQAILNNGSVPYGTAKDSPGWATRGMMLDVGRHYYPPDFLIEMCAYMSFFKQNTFHIHLSDNLWNNPRYSRQQSLSLYARFRLWTDATDVAGLNKYKNESFTREEFETIQTSCAARGITILPEIEAPGHALTIVQWKPELGLSTDLSLLNISHPQTIPTMKTIWKTFLPWFHSKVVHIGADEYTASVSDYNRFVNEMASFITSESNKSTRIWGTFPPKPSYTNNISKNVTIQHWAFFEDNPYNDYIKNNYSVLNSDDTFYVVSKWSGSYPQSLPYNKTFTGNPANNGLWYPHIFDANNAENNPPRNNPLALGSIAPLWNDYGPNSSVYSDAYYSWKFGIPAISDKQWGADLGMNEFMPLFDRLHPKIPGQNLERRVATKGDLILRYTFDQPSNSTAVKDLSGNGYDGKTTCARTASGSLFMDGKCALFIPLGSKGKTYTMSLTLTISNISDPTNTTLMFGRDSNLLLTPTITLLSGGNYFRTNQSKITTGEKVQLLIYGGSDRTQVQTMWDGGQSGQESLYTILGINGESMRTAYIDIEAPLERVGGLGSGWTGEVHGMDLLDHA